MVKQNNFFGFRNYKVNPCIKAEQEHTKELKEISMFFKTGTEEDILIGYEWLSKIIQDKQYAKMNTLMYVLKHGNQDSYEVDGDSFKIEVVDDLEEAKHLHLHISINGKEETLCCMVPTIAMMLNVPKMLIEKRITQHLMQSNYCPNRFIDWKKVK